MQFLKICIALVFVLVFSRLSGFSQERCGTGVYAQYLEQQNPSLKQRRVDAAIKMTKKMASYRTAAVANKKVYRIPVVVHVIWNTTASNVTDEVIFSQIKILNEDYRRLNADTVNTFDLFQPVAGDAGFEFFLAAKDPQGNPTNGIVRKYTPRTSFAPQELDQNLKPLSFWPDDQYLNLWVTSLNTGFIGVGPVPEDVFSGTNDTLSDGVVIDYHAFGNNSFTYYLGRTATHEIGHWLGLIHVWGSNAECGSDSVDDTPVQRSDNQYLAKTCPAHFSNCTGPSTQDMADNYMDYSPDQCMNIFTKGQAFRMRFVMENNPFRIAIQNSPAQMIASSGTALKDMISFKLFPNPARDRFTYNIDHTGAATYIITLYNSVGQEVYTIASSLNNNELDISTLPPGIYQVVWGIGKDFQSQTKLIKLP